MISDPLMASGGRPGLFGQSSAPQVLQGRRGGSSEEIRPPITNRGSVPTTVEHRKIDLNAISDSYLSSKNSKGADDGVTVHVDYMDLTVRTQDFDDLFLRFDDFLSDEFGVISWRDLVKADSAVSAGTRHLEGPGGIHLRQDKRDFANRMVNVRLKGEACQMFGDSRLLSMMRFLSTVAPTHAKRLDVAWDGHQVSPCDFYTWTKDGTYIRSRCLGADDASWQENSEGQTAYLGSRRKGERLVRVYNRRGFNRLELEVSDRVARKLGQLMLDSDVEKWPAIFHFLLTDTVDFLVPAAADYFADHSSFRGVPRIKQWREFVGEASRCRVLSAVPDSLAPDILASSALACSIRRNRRQLLVLMRMFPEDPQRVFSYLLSVLADDLDAMPADSRAALLADVDRLASQSRHQVEVLGFNRPRSWGPVASIPL